MLLFLVLSLVLQRFYTVRWGGDNEIVNSDTGKQPSGAALPCEGELSKLRSSGTPASLLSSRHLSCRSIRGLGLLDERAEDLPEEESGNNP